MLSLKKGIVYKAIKPKRVWFGIKVSLSLLLLGAPAVMVIAALPAALKSPGSDAAGAFIVGLILFAIIAVILIKSLKTDKRVLNRQQEILESFDENLLERLEEEVRTAEKYFGCIYVLDEYFFVPKAGLLIRYDEIRTFKTIYHSTNGIPDGVYIEVFDRENIKYRFSVNKWRDYKNSYNEFMALLSRKGLGGEQKNPGNGGYIPVGNG